MPSRGICPLNFKMSILKVRPAHSNRKLNRFFFTGMAHVHKACGFGINKGGKILKSISPVAITENRQSQAENGKLPYEKGSFLAIKSRTGLLHHDDMSMISSVSSPAQASSWTKAALANRPFPLPRSINARAW